jgi:hypothetical protein
MYGIIHFIAAGIILLIFFYVIEQIKDAYKNIVIILKVQNEHLREIIQRLNKKEIL